MKDRTAIKIIKQFGFTESQAKLFYAGFANGPSLMSHLAEKAIIPRGTAYYLMSELQRRGFFTAKKHGKRTVYVAASGKRLLQMAQEREKLIKKLIYQTKNL
ncbi:MAG: helix-turn-helix domain-containing protein [Patescibacteria group bacterium]